MADYQARLQTVAGEMSKIESELEKAVEIRQRLDSQRSENEQVQLEFKRLKTQDSSDGEGGEGDAIYKLIGPVLLKQDTAEAKANVDKRIEFIDAEIKRVEAQLQEISQRSEKKRQEIVAIQQEAQQHQQQQAGAETVSA